MQGVGRYSMAARALGITGWVRNRGDAPREGMSDAPPRESGGGAGAGSGAGRPATAPPPAGGGCNDFEDDIPF